MTDVRYGDLLRQGTARLADAGIDGPRLDAKFLLMEAGGLTSADLIAVEGERVPDAAFERFNLMISRRINREPVSLILGHIDFMGLSFLTDERALAPRQDSERLVELALEKSADAAEGRIIDLGTGSGCLLLSFLANRPGWTGTAVDISPQALSLARENADRLGLADRVNFIEGSWASGTAALTLADLVISNPPYIPAADIERLDPEVREHDPLLALVGGEDGLEAYQDILTLLSDTLRVGIPVLFEIGFDQADALKGLAARHGFAEFTVHTDFSGHNRVVHMRKP